MFVDAAAVLGEDGEVDVEVLRFFFENGDFGFEGFFGHIGEFVFGVGGEIFCGLVFAEIAALVLNIGLNFCIFNEDLPDGLDAEFAQLVIPILEPFLVLCQHFLVLLELVAHLNLDTTGLIELCGLAIEFLLQS